MTISWRNQGRSRCCLKPWHPPFSLITWYLTSYTSTWLRNWSRRKVRSKSLWSRLSVMNGLHSTDTMVFPVNCSCLTSSHSLLDETQKTISISDDNNIFQLQGTCVSSTHKICQYRLLPWYIHLVSSCRTRGTMSTGTSRGKNLDETNCFNSAHVVICIGYYASTTHLYLSIFATVFVQGSLAWELWNSRDWISGREFIPIHSTSVVRNVQFDPSQSIIRL